VRFRASDAAAATRGELVGADAELTGATWDSRDLRCGQLFVALRGERDGHDYLAAARAAGAGAALVTQDDGGGPSIVVPDTLEALQALAAWGRGRLTDRVVGITGSVGKTSVKDFTAAALRTRWRTHAPVRSFNNEQGLPVTVLEAPDDTEVLVLEMGMRGFGQITALVEIGRPLIGVVVRVADAHTEAVGGSIDGVARAKGELVEGLPSHGTAVLNADDEHVLAMRSRTAARVLTFGCVGGDVRAETVRLDELARPVFDLATPWGRQEVALGVPGAHMAVNAAAAAAAALVLDVDLASVAEGLSVARLSPWRMEIHRLPSGAVVVNDAYNANPASMRAALDTLARLPARRRIAVVGLMAELHRPEPDHRAIAEEAAARGITLVPVGTRLYGVDPVDDAVEALGSLAGGDAVLVKGSRVAGLERLVHRLLAD
jgi:UDP-N-acetylmuramoyl-tripeptide--D-alanyl-D-alanine ligase